MNQGRVERVALAVPVFVQLQATLMRPDEVEFFWPRCGSQSLLLRSLMSSRITWNSLRLSEEFEPRRCRSLRFCKAT
jgi:hypothetical protein